MQKQQQVVSVAHSNFDLKNISVNLIPPQAESQVAFLSVQELEAVRAERRAVPASKHGLEVICGGSCETGAQ
jgi:hypothetical protein